MSTDLTTGIVRILRPDGATAGTGFVVSDDGPIATCAHVVQYAGAAPGDTVRIVFRADGQERESRLELDWWCDPSAESGLFPALRDGGVPGSEDCHLPSFRPGADPFAGLAAVGLELEPEGDPQPAIHAWLNMHPGVGRLVWFGGLRS